MAFCFCDSVLNHVDVDVLIAHLDAGVPEGGEDVVVDAVVDIPVILVFAPGADGVLDDAGAELLDQHLRSRVGKHLVGAAMAS